ncbi:MAG: hypothetical protein AAF198_01280 [Pseudomonadota bacterium]
MELNIKQDVDAPIGFVFDKMTAFEAHEMRAMAAGISAKRTIDTQTQISWDTSFDYLGKPRNMALTVDEIAPPEAMFVALDGSQLNAEADVKLLELSPYLTRIRLKLSINGKSLRARLMVQSARLAKQNITRRMQSRLSGFASEIEFDYLQTR